MSMLRDSPRKGSLSQPPDIFAAVRAGDVTHIETLLGSSDGQALDEAGNTPLHIAALYGSFEVVDKLCSVACPNIHTKNEQGQTPLQLARSAKPVSEGEPGRWQQKKKILKRLSAAAKAATLPEAHEDQPAEQLDAIGNSLVFFLLGCFVSTTAPVEKRRELIDVSDSGNEKEQVPEEPEPVEKMREIIEVSDSEVEKHVEERREIIEVSDSEMEKVPEVLEAVEKTSVDLANENLPEEPEHPVAPKLSPENWQSAQPVPPRSTSEKSKEKVQLQATRSPTVKSSKSLSAPSGFEDNSPNGEVDLKWMESDDDGKAVGVAPLDPAASAVPSAPLTSKSMAGNPYHDEIRWSIVEMKMVTTTLASAKPSLPTPVAGNHPIDLTYMSCDEQMSGDDHQTEWENMASKKRLEPISEDHESPKAIEEPNPESEEKAAESQASEEKGEVENVLVGVADSPVNFQSERWTVNENASPSSQEKLMLEELERIRIRRAATPPTSKNLVKATTPDATLPVPVPGAPRREPKASDPPVDTPAIEPFPDEEPAEVLSARVECDPVDIAQEEQGADDEAPAPNFKATPPNRLATLGKYVATENLPSAPRPQPRRASRLVKKPEPAMSEESEVILPKKRRRKKNSKAKKSNKRKKPAPKPRTKAKKATKAKPKPRRTTRIMKKKLRSAVKKFPSAKKKKAVKKRAKAKSKMPMKRIPKQRRRRGGN